MDRHVLSFKKTCYFACVVLDGIATHLIKAHDFNHLFKCTFLCDDDICDRLATLESACFSDIMSHARLTIFIECLCCCTSHSVCFAQCAHFKGHQHPNPNLMQQLTTRDVNLSSDGWTASCPLSAQKKR